MLHIENGLSMARTLLVGDMHNKVSVLDRVDWVLQAQKELGSPVDRVVFLGDLLNEFGYTARMEMKTFSTLESWVWEHKKEYEVIVLAGNHDLAYIVNSSDPDYDVLRYICPGPTAQSVSWLHGRARALFAGVAVVLEGGVLCSHAGFTHGWLETRVPERWRGSAKGIVDYTNSLVADDNMLPLVDVGYARGGLFGVDPSPCWADMTELMEDAEMGYVQVVGHTPRERAGYYGGDGCELWFCDTNSHLGSRHGSKYGNGDMLVYEYSVEEKEAEDSGSKPEGGYSTTEFLQPGFTSSYSKDKDGRVIGTEYKSADGSVRAAFRVVNPGKGIKHA